MWCDTHLSHRYGANMPLREFVTFVWFQIQKDSNIEIRIVEFEILKIFSSLQFSMISFRTRLSILWNIVLNEFFIMFLRWRWKISRTYKQNLSSFYFNVSSVSWTSSKNSKYLPHAPLLENMLNKWTEVEQNKTTKMKLKNKIQNSRSHRVFSSRRSFFHLFKISWGKYWGWIKAKKGESLKFIISNFYVKKVKSIFIAADLIPKNVRKKNLRH